MSRIETKVCSKCHEEKPLSSDYFNKNKANKDGFNGQCKECKKEYLKQWRQKNPEYNKKYYAENLEYFKEYYQENAEYHREFMRQYIQDNKEYLSEKSREYQQSERGRLMKKARKQKRKSLENSLPCTLTIDEYKATLEFFDNKCAYCECDLDESHHQDHVLALSKGGGYTKENIVPACATCNLSKGASYLGHWYIQQSFYSLESLVKVTNIINNFKPWIVKAQEE